MIDSSLECHICSSKRLAEKPFGYHFNGKWLGGVTCRNCGIIFIEPQPTREELAQLYSHEYFEGDYRCGHAGSYFDEQSVAALQDSTPLGRIKALKPSGNLLEIGCAGGAFLHQARQAGYSVQGVEFSPEMAQLARQKFRLDVLAGELHDAKFPSGMFDVVFMGDVLEHIAHPFGLLKEIHRITKVSGLLVVEVPSQTNTFFSRLGFAVYTILGKRTTVNLPPYHLFEYRPKSLTVLLRYTGFSMMKLTQSIMLPKEIAQRGPKLQNIGKKFFQYPNYLITKLFRIYGDRIEAMAIKADQPAE